MSDWINCHNLRISLLQLAPTRNRLFPEKNGPEAYSRTPWFWEQEEGPPFRLELWACTL